LTVREQYCTVIIGGVDMELQYTYWQEKSGWFLGYLNDDPEHWTQGKTVDELEEMLLDLYEIGKREKEMVIKKTGTLVVPA
jgi:predicted RNase H-like HicB family nuclease